MGIVKAASDRGRFGMLSAPVLAVFGLAFLPAGVGFRLLGRVQFNATVRGRCRARPVSAPCSSGPLDR
ncbi:hypothetical protein [Brevirhabdus sp.]|uniref:hypothetical protein n=1 Tax=Brevirhabdus sp. TaxID=2004514 RepID=UPI0040580525